jgi:hypothetical protein
MGNMKKKKFEDIKGVIRSHKSRRRCNTIVKRERTMFYKTLHRKLKLDAATQTPLKTGGEYRWSRRVR